VFEQKLRFDLAQLFPAEFVGFAQNALIQKLKHGNKARC